MEERVAQKQNKNTRMKGNKKETGGKDIQEPAKRRRRTRNRQTADFTLDAASNNSVNCKQDKRTNSVCEQGENRRENKMRSRNDQNRRYGMVVEDIYIDMEDIVYDIQNGKLSLEALPKLGLFPLHEAVARGLTKCAESLIGLGLQLTSETPDGLTPLEVAVMAGNFDAAALLIQYGAPIDRIRDGIPQFC
ncbi:uncharacterized protein LOC144646687 [Oculina patagonica]